MGEYETWIKGSRVRFDVFTAERNPTPANPEDCWVAWTELSRSQVSNVLGLYDWGQFAGEGRTEVEAVLDLVEMIEEGN
jgi:hypothetical protein